MQWRHLHDAIATFSLSKVYFSKSLNINRSFRYSSVIRGNHERSGIGYFAEGCPVCFNKKYACDDRKDRANGLVDRETLTRVKAELTAIIASLPGTEIEQAEEIKESLDIAMKSGSERDAEHALKAMGKFVQKAQTAIATAGNAADTTLGAYKKITSLIETLSPALRGLFS